MSLAPAALAFADTLRQARMRRPAFEALQARRLTRWLARDLPRVAAYAGFTGGLEDLPVTDKAQVMARFSAFNRAGISAEQGWQAYENNQEIDGVTIGASTGTSGNRALYAITEAERMRWLGAILGRTVPGFLIHPERVAVILPQSSALYEGANRTRRIRLRFFDLREGPERWQAALEAFDPTSIVAPPRLLRHLAETARLAPRRLYAGGETLDPVDRAVIEARFGIPLGQIYMATEGLFAVSCPHGRLHLAEDVNHFEFEPVGEGLVSPLVTSFRRSFQIVARYRMNDLLRLSPEPCPCGAAQRVVREVVGRMDDAFAFGATLVTPDILRNAVLGAAREIDDFRVLREGEQAVTLVLNPTVPNGAAEAARAELTGAFARRGLAPEVTLRREALGLDPHRKLRRVENRWRGA